MSYVPGSGILVLSTAFDVNALKAAGAVLTFEYAVGNLPANARVLRAEVQCTQTFAAVGLTTVVATVQKSGATPGELVASASVAVNGLFASLLGTNPYCSRGGQAISVIVTTGVALLNALTAGALTVRVFYTVAPAA